MSWLIYQVVKYNKIVVGYYPTCLQHVVWNLILVFLVFPFHPLRSHIVIYCLAETGC